MAEHLKIEVRLKYEFPEVADRYITNSRTKDGFTPWVGYLAGIHDYKRIRGEREASIATELSIDISPYTIDHAGSICMNQLREQRLKADLVAFALKSMDSLRS